MQFLSGMHNSVETFNIEIKPYEKFYMYSICINNY